MKIVTFLPPVLALLWALPAWGFDSGSTDADGALSPTVDTQVALPADGILHYSTVTIPSEVTVTFARNALNTPVRILVSGDVTIDGTIDVSGEPSADIAAAGDGNPGDDGLPGRGGPGGYSGGIGGNPGPRGDLVSRGGNGLGPGGGLGVIPVNHTCGAYGGSFGARSPRYTYSCSGHSESPDRPLSYGTPELLPLTGGSGGAGGTGGAAFPGSGGGGGGGALLIAASGTITIEGAVFARGGRSGTMSAASVSLGTVGGGGSGGGIRIIASILSGTGQIDAAGGTTGSGSRYGRGTSGGAGRIRLEADTFQYTGSASPVYSFGAPGVVVLPGRPSIRISEVGGVSAPALPTGTADVSLPAATTNPVTVQISSSNVPLGNTATVQVIPPIGDTESVVSTALSGTLAAATATAEVNLPDGHSVLQVVLSYTVSGSSGDGLSFWTEGERVERVELIAGLHSTETVLITASGRRVTLPAGS